MSLLENINRGRDVRRQVAPQFRRYRSTLFWLYRELLRRYPVAATLALIGNFLGPMLMGSALASLIHLVGRMEKNKPLVIDWLNLTLDLRQPQNFALMVGGVGAMMLASAIILFLANRISIHIATRFALDQSRFTLVIGGGRPARDADPEAGPYPRDVERCAKSIVGMARAIRPLMQVFQPLFLFLFSLAALFYINTFLTLIVLAVVLPSLVFQYRINLTVVQNEEFMSPALRRMQKGINALLKDLALAPRVGASMDKVLKESYSLIVSWE